MVELDAIMKAIDREKDCIIKIKKDPKGGVVYATVERRVEKLIKL